MTISIYLRFSSSSGQQLRIYGNIAQLGNGQVEQALLMTYVNNNYWQIDIPLDSTSTKSLNNFSYSFLLLQNDCIVKIDNGTHRSFNIKKIKNDLVIVDSWNDIGRIENIYHTAPFTNVILKNRMSFTKAHFHKGLHFSVEAPFLKKGQQLIITGNNKVMGNWLTEGYIPMQFNGKKWIAEIDFIPSTSLIEYKYCVLEGDQEEITYEEGENRVFSQLNYASKQIFIEDAYARINHIRWRGTGIAIPVFSLRTRKSLGVGEFNDIKKLVDWAASVTIKMIQLLPVNDTTLTHSNLDSYPYASISAFALHPIYLSIEKIAGNQWKHLIKPFLQQRKRLNASKDLAYETVMNLKWDALKVLHQAMAEELAKIIDYKKFIDEQKDWLFPYAAFSYLRDKFKTRDTNQWKGYKIYGDGIKETMYNPDSIHHKELSFFFFIQYHAHKQLSEAHTYATKKGIVLKGDIPIGVNRCSVETWTAPSLFNMNMQAGAPPDDFAVKGQNWGFPTYNWQTMKVDGYRWWKNRFNHMVNYFDAFRIDHILGFFRIWSIPIEQIEGIMGRFVPAIPLLRSEFDELDIDFTTARYCRPFITDTILLELFGEDFNDLSFFLDEDLDGSYSLKSEFGTQKEIELYFNTLDDTDKNKRIKSVLYNLISNVILFQDDEKMDEFHFRINMSNTTSFEHLDKSTKQKLSLLYNDYFYYRQDFIWKNEALEKLPMLKNLTEMLVCGEDLGFIPRAVPEVMSSLGILSLDVQRMPKQSNTAFFNPATANYLSVVTPSTHDMSTIREWWEENKISSQIFYNEELSQLGEAPPTATPNIVQSIILQHLSSPAMWAIFQLQDLLAMNEELRTDSPKEERINIPENPKHYWKYRMNITIEDLMKNDNFNDKLNFYIQSNGRA
jgi:4-alpha-glucanotransferase